MYFFPAYLKKLILTQENVRNLLLGTYFQFLLSFAKS